MQSVVNNIVNASKDVYSHYHRLILLVGPANSGKTEILSAVAEELHAPTIQMSLELSYRLLDLSDNLRVARVEEILHDLIDATKSNIVILDKTEILFEPLLCQDSLRMLQGLSRNHTIISSWNGRIEEGFMYHAVPSHPEYRQYTIDDLTCYTTCDD